MLTSRKRVFWALLPLILAYFILFIFPNAQGAADEHMLFLTSPDENIQYPNLLRMLTPGSTLIESLKHFFNHQHYIYGYPFYFFNALAALPLKIIYGADLAAHTQTLILFLRQGISVLPMLAALVIFTALQTGLRSFWRSAALFLFLAFVPGVFRQNIQWWHPDALTVLAVALTFYFLDRDQLRFGRNFYFAAAACGLAAGTKLIGFFFFLAIAWYLLTGLRRRCLTWPQALKAGALFILILFAVFILTNPLLLIPQTRAAILQVHQDHNFSFTHGWENQDAYAKGPLSWLPVLERWYGSGYFLAFALLSLLMAALAGPRRLHNQLILAWALPYTAYLGWVIAVRPDHYWLPVLIPVFSALLALTELPSPARPSGEDALAPTVAFPRAAPILLVGFLLAAQFIANLQTDARLYRRSLDLEPLLRACDTTPIILTSGEAFEPEAGRWYVVQQTQADLMTQRFTVISAGQPLPDDSQQAWGCSSAEKAQLRAAYAAEDQKLSFPNQRVFGPDGREILR